MTKTIDSELTHFFRRKGLQLDLNGTALSKILARFQLYQRIEHTPGDVVECGVYRGAALFQWANFVEIFSPKSQREVIGFDTFAGFPDNHTRVNDGDSIRNLAKEIHPRSVDELVRLATELGIDHRIKLIEGDAATTIPSFAKSNPSLRIALLHLDFDTYEPTRIALDHLYPHVVSGGLVLFDQYGDRDWNETEAVDTFFRDQGSTVKFVRIPWAAAPRAFVIKDEP